MIDTYTNVNLIMCVGIYLCIMLFLILFIPVYRIRDRGYIEYYAFRLRYNLLSLTNLLILNISCKYHI